MYDAIIVGARCAGSPTAMLLARKGYRVLVVDRATFPSDTFRNHGIMYPGVRKLREWGLLDRVLATNVPLVRRVTQDMDDFSLTGTLPVVDGLGGLYAPRRKYLDNILVEAAVEAGAELREGFAVRELVWDGDKVVGIRGRSHGGALVEARAPIVIGADGQYSMVARSVQAPRYNERPVLSWSYYSYWADVPIDDFLFYRQDDAVMLSFPTNDGLACVAIQAPPETFAAFRTDIEGNFARMLDRFPALAARVHQGRRAERFQGTGDMTNFFRKPFGPGWALVGDAGYHKDPITGQGISDAFRDAALLAEAVDAGLSGNAPLLDALAVYEARRNAAAFPSYEANIQAITFGPLPAEVLGLRAALRENPEATTQYFGMLLGAISPLEFFAPENMARIMGAPAFAAAA
jgi:flavin-dependent dehydrogenase